MSNKPLLGIAQPTETGIYSRMEITIKPVHQNDSLEPSLSEYPLSL